MAGVLDVAGPAPELRAPRAAARAAAEPPAPAKVYLWLMILFFVLEYARPPGIVLLKLQMVIIVLIPIAWFLARSRPWSPLLTVQVLFLAQNAAAVPFASNNYSAYFATRMIFGCVSIAVGLSWLMSNRDGTRRLMWAWLLVMAYVAGWAVTHGGRGPGGFLGDENDLALACVTAFPLAFYGFEFMRGWRRFACLGFAVLLAVAVVVSFSRGGFLGLAAGGLYCFIASRHKLRDLALLLVAALAFVGLAPQSYLDELETIVSGSQQGTAESRRFLWTTATRMWQQNPVLGVGGLNFSWQVGRYQPRDDFLSPAYQERDWSGTTTHSLYYQMLAEQGTVGMALLAAMVLLHFRTLWRLRRDLRRIPGLHPDVIREADLYGGGLGGAMFAFLVSGAFISVAYYPYHFYFAGMAVGLDAALRREAARHLEAAAGAAASSGRR
jgi:O-antigen ligase